MVIVLTIAVVLIGLLYLALTFFPIIDDVCLYFTPNVGRVAAPAAQHCPAVIWLWSWFATIRAQMKNPDQVDFHFPACEESTGRRGPHYAHPVAPATDNLIMSDKGELHKFIDSIPPQILVRLSSSEADSRKKAICDHLFQDSLDNKDKLTSRSALSTSRYV